MIPRHDRSAPAVRPIGAAGSEARGQQQQQQAPPAFKRYTIFLPEQVGATTSSTAAPPAIRKASADGLSSEAVALDGGTRVYSFVRSANCRDLPPRLLATDIDIDDAGQFVSADNGYDLDADGSGPSSSAREKKQPGAWRRRVPMKKGEPCRLAYTAVEKGRGGGDWQLCSVALPEYEALTCALLRQPQQRQQPATGNGCVIACPLAKPVMELRLERVSTAATTTTATSGNHVGSGRGISSAWLAAPTGRFHKADWKSMDAIDKAEASGPRGGDGDSDEAIERRWTGDDDDNGDSEDGPPRKKSRRATPAAVAATVASVTDIAAALARNRQHLPSQHADAMHSGGGGYGRSPYGYMSSSPVYGASAVDSLAPVPVPVPVAVAVAVAGARPAEPTQAPLVRTAATGATTAPASPPPVAQPPRDQSSSSTTTTSTPLATLADCGLAAMGELQGREGREGRQYATLKELERVVLRRLPTYDAVAAKAKTADGKAEAVNWFRVKSKELKLWLVQYGCTIDPTGLVSFPPAK